VHRDEAIYNKQGAWHGCSGSVAAIIMSALKTDLSLSLLNQVRVSNYNPVGAATSHTTCRWSTRTHSTLTQRTLSSCLRR
jgi:hypothetical protein